MGELVVSAIPEDQGGFDPLVILGVVWALTLLAGIAVGWACCRAPAPRTTAGEEALVAWERLTRRAIKFVNKRRRVGVAFNGYKRFTLRNTEGSRPTQGRRARRRSTTPGAPLLHEGPVVNHGPHGR